MFIRFLPGVGQPFNLGPMRLNFIAVLQLLYTEATKNKIKKQLQILRLAALAQDDSLYITATN
jgi:hypothetical protein